MKDVKFTKLPNGLTIITDFNPSIETVFTGVWVSVGSRNENENINVNENVLIPRDETEILVKKGYDFKWFSIGKGELKDELLQKVKEKNLEEKFIFQLSTFFSIFAG